MKTINLGRYLGLEITAHPSAIVGLLLLWAVLAALGIGLLDLPIGAALAGGFIAALLHYLSEFAHQGGHAFAARRTGHPMLGMRYWWVLGSSILSAGRRRTPGFSSFTAGAWRCSVQPHCHHICSDCCHTPPSCKHVLLDGCFHFDRQLVRLHARRVSYHLVLRMEAHSSAFGANANYPGNTITLQGV